MLMRILKAWLQPTDAGSASAKEETRRRRGATAMEYLVAISFILVVLILAIQHLGFTTRKSLANSANATKFTGS